MKKVTSILLLLAGCGGGGGGGDTPSGGPTPSPNPASGAHVYYLNFDGQTLTAGPDDPVTNSSQLVFGTTTLPAYLAGDPQRTTKIQAMVSEVTAILAPYDIAVVTARPASGSYDMLVAGGISPFGAGEPFAALSDCTGARPNHVALMFDVSTGHDAARRIIGSLGIGHGISSSDAAADCMCFGPNCTVPLPAACTIGGANTPISFVVKCDMANTMDVNQKFLSVFGAHP